MARRFSSHQGQESCFYNVDNFIATSEAAMMSLLEKDSVTAMVNTKVHDNETHKSCFMSVSSLNTTAVAVASSGCLSSSNANMQPSDSNASGGSCFAPANSKARSSLSSLSAAAASKASLSSGGSLNTLIAATKQSSGSLLEGSAAALKRGSGSSNNTLNGAAFLKRGSESSRETGSAQEFMFGSKRTLPDENGASPAPSFISVLKRPREQSPFSSTLDFSDWFGSNESLVHRYSFSASDGQDLNQSVFTGLSNVQEDLTGFGYYVNPSEDPAAPSETHDSMNVYAINESVSSPNRLEAVEQNEAASLHENHEEDNLDPNDYESGSNIDEANDNESSSSSLSNKGEENGQGEEAAENSAEDSDNESVFSNEQDEDASLVNPEENPNANDSESVSISNDEEDEEAPLVAPEENPDPENAPPVHSPSGAERSDVAVNEITDEDILCGRRYTHTRHPGNAFYLQMIEANKARYLAFGNQHGEKTAIRNSIVQDLTERGRFVKKVEGGRHSNTFLAHVRTSTSREVELKPPPNITYA